jgi:Ca2+-binding RTX toxin-like protein
MAHPVYILAGQSNARAMRDAITHTLQRKHGSERYTLVDVSAAGAPLTYKRPDADWSAANELKQTLIEETRAALAARAETELAGLIWIQGEADSYAIARSHSYQSALEGLTDAWRTALLQTPEGRAGGADVARVALARLSDHASGGTPRENWETVQAQQLAYGAGDPLTNTVDPDAIAREKGVSPANMFSDGLHYHEAFRPALAEALVNALHSNGAGAAGGIGTPGDDILSGTAGGDRMQGGAGNDSYIFNHADDRIVEAADQGRDRVVALRDVDLDALGAEIEDIVLAGGADLSAIGNASANRITGNSGDNRIDGAGGRDRLAGGDGDDRLIDRDGGDHLSGGAGDDTYRLFAGGFRLFEESDAGRDLVIARVSVTLRFHSQHIEDLSLTGPGDLNGTGNGLSNRLTGNRGDNRLDGAWGDDILKGRAGSDELIGHRGDDVMTGGRGSDRFVFHAHHGPGHDRITDFDPARDMIVLGADIGRDQLDIAAEGPGLLLSWTGDQSVLLLGLADAEPEPPWLVFL